MGVVAESSRWGVNLRVLLVEDLQDDADLVLEELRSQGYDPVHMRVENAAQMKAALTEHSWDVVLCDYAMPRFDALSALAIMKSAELDLPFIIVSGTMGEDTAVRAMRAGAHDFFCKDKLARLPAAIERELRDAAVRLERRKMQDQMLLADRLVSIGTLAAGVAHEINNPLAYVIGNLEFALERLTNLPPTAAGADELVEVIQALKQAREGSERIRVTTRDLKIFCRTDEGDRSAVDVERALESAISMAWNEIRHRARLTRVFESVPPVDANENRLAQVFLNLLVNAAQAMPEGNIREHEIRITLRAESARVVIEISDTGSGMSEEVQARLFEPFFTTKPVGVGTGLGLPICHGIVTGLGGEISMRSQAGVGSVFRVELPAGELVQEHKVSYPATPPSDRARILVIDDEPALCQIVQRLLSGDNDVTTALNGRIALEKLALDRSFDIILCDLMMPEMNGMDFYAELARSAPDLAQRIVFLTGGAFTAQAAKFLEQVPHRRLDKPFDPSTLRATIAKLIAAVGFSKATRAV